MSIILRKVGIFMLFALASNIDVSSKAQSVVETLTNENVTDMVKTAPKDNLFMWIGLIIFVVVIIAFLSDKKSQYSMIEKNATELDNIEKELKVLNKNLQEFISSQKYNCNRFDDLFSKIGNLEESVDKKMFVISRDINEIKNKI